MKRYKINTFAELMDLISYDWYEKGLQKDGELYHLNKLSISPTEASYKTELYDITNPLVYQKLEKFYELLQETTLQKSLYHE